MRANGCFEIDGGKKQASGQGNRVSGVAGTRGCSREQTATRAK
jgi:hypothetical protein